MKVKHLLLVTIIFFTSCTGSDKQPVFQGVFEGAPRINDPSVIGNYPGTPFLFAIPTSGERPLTWTAEGLPAGLELDPSTGIISGTVDGVGDYVVHITASNVHGADSGDLRISIGDKLALTPVMGWNSWNTFGATLTEELVMQMADVMVSSGMRDLGYAYINIDDHWQLKERGADGHIQINKEKFPNGIKAVADYVHARGLKLGIYSDAAEYTCGGVCGSLNYEETDALDFAAWGVDLLKYDYCGAPQDKAVAIERYTKMGNALRETKRSIVYSICEWGQLEPWMWAKEAGGHYWRTTWDIRDQWHTERYNYDSNGILNILDINSKLADYAGPGGWNDPDMLVVGISGQSHSINNEQQQGCTDVQYRTHMSLWCMMASPLLCGNDLRTMSDETMTTLMNPEIIAINQDMMGKQGKYLQKSLEGEIWIKPLVNNRFALAFVNKGSEVYEVDFDFSQVNLPVKLAFRDVWAHKELGVIKNQFKTSVQPYDCQVYVVE